MYFLQTQLDLVAAVRHVQECGFSHTAARDETLVVKTVLTEATGGPALRPWRLEARADRMAIVTAYSAFEPGDVERRRRLALPTLQAAVGEIRGVAMPALSAGERFRFTIRTCPTLHVTPGRAGIRHGERDAYLHAVDLAGGELTRSREEVYADYLRERLPGAQLEQIQLVGLRVVRTTRKARADQWSIKAMPIADLAGVLHVIAAEAFAAALSQGIGRQRAFGCGMLRLEPLPLAVAA